MLRGGTTGHKTTHYILARRPKSLLIHENAIVMQSNQAYTGLEIMLTSVSPYLAFLLPVQIAKNRKSPVTLSYPVFYCPILLFLNKRKKSCL